MPKEELESMEAEIEAVEKIVKVSQAELKSLQQGQQLDHALNFLNLFASSTTQN